MLGVFFWGGRGVIGLYTIENSLPDAQSEFKEDLFLSLAKQIFYHEAFVSVNCDF
jgi:hypothetical protein